MGETLRKFIASVSAIVMALVGAAMFTSGPASADIPDPELRQEYQQQVIPSGQTVQLVTFCPGGYRVISGGYNLWNQNPTMISVQETRAYLEGNAWMVVVKANSGDRLAGAYALCAKLTQ